MEHFAKTFYADTDKFYDYYTETLSPYFYEKLSEVSEARRARVERVKNDAVKAELLAAELVRNYALKTVFGIENPETELNEYEKPYLKGEKDKFFNISHSMNIVACTVSDAECGLDIECFYNPHDLMNVVSRFFSTQEQSVVMMSQNPVEAFCRLWTIRESYVKMRGTGFSMGLKALKCGFRRGKASMFENEIYQKDADFKEFRDIYRYRGCICTPCEVEHEVIKIEI
jgi:4'-phosphopantetheinyl transferase